MRAVSPILPENTDDAWEQAIVVQPTRRPPTTIAPTTVAPSLRTTTPILLSRISSMTNADAAKRARIQARWRKLGPLVKSVQYPYIRRNLHRIVIADSDSVRISDTVRRIVEQRLRKAAAQKTSAHDATTGPRAHAGGTLLSSDEGMQQRLASKVAEWQRAEEAEQLSTSNTGTKTISSAPETTVVQEFSNGTSPTIAASTAASFTATSEPAETTSTTSSSSSPTSSPGKLIPFSFSTPSYDYHFRKITPARKFKFTQKLRRQPRLRIRKPGPIFELIYFAYQLS
ncbi:unnamed protein product [Gongylonema pulchrum]|uniref:Uncharacterized protein n=1 Tax=Gongylonema pulchrum TaxID=637853 RepID=A0A3P6PWI4_9BILA|nr:unnamed protein product [Gongylonema pulchrum]